ncbi:MAG TPA: hypothetical protein VHU42_18765 [Rhodopila sp.]|nr:hypothetical protein [Rhodopila sp.]
MPATPAELREKALHYREMVAIVVDQRIIDALESLADEYDAMADRLEQAGRDRVGL